MRDQRALLSVGDVERFWAWFRSKACEIAILAEREDSQSLKLLLDGPVERLIPRAGWEVGPGSASKWAFTLSPNGIRDLLPLTQCAINGAAPVDGWEFHPAKPPKKWNFQFTMRNNIGQSVNVDARGWKYLLTAYGNRSFFDIGILAENLPRMNQRGAAQAAHIAIEGALGEKLMLERIGDVTLIRHLEREQDRDRLSPLGCLSDHISKLIEGVV